MNKTLDGKCNVCGAEVDRDTHNYCTNCGCSTEEGEKKCPVCEAKLTRITAKYCGQCGNPVKEGVKPIER